MMIVCAWRTARVVKLALVELERYTQARIGNVHAPETTESSRGDLRARYGRVRSKGYAAPQLHTHAVIFNVTEMENGQTRALQPQELFASQRFATQVYRAELANRLQGLGYEIERGQYGQPEIKGYTKEYLAANSLRREQVKDHLRAAGSIARRRRRSRRIARATPSNCARRRKC